MNNYNPRVSVIIRCCNEAVHIGRLLDGILEQTFREVEIILVDSGSADATLTIASRYPVRILSIAPEEFSFGRSLNRGCQAAGGDILVLASAHVYPVYRDWLEKLVQPFADPQVALVYGKQRGATTTRFSEHQIFAKWFPEESNGRQSHPFCNNANAAIRRSLWQQFPYDETLTGLEDLDWGKRVQAAGYSIAYCAEAEIIHVHQETPVRIYNRYRREAMALKRIFPAERFGLNHFASLLAGNVVSDWYHAWKQGHFLQQCLDIPLFRLMQFWGTFKGFREPQLNESLKQTFYYPRRLAPLADLPPRPAARIQYQAQPEPAEKGT